jgi:hypothetical protein
MCKTGEKTHTVSIKLHDNTASLWATNISCILISHFHGETCSSIGVSDKMISVLKYCSYKGLYIR